MNVFITATGTDAGKTFVACGLLRQLRSFGKQVAGLKPIVSGFDPMHIPASDPAMLLEAAGVPITVDAVADISPFRFAAPLAPAMAAALEGVSLDYPALLKYCAAAVNVADRTTLIEGVGGVMVPLNATHSVLDWMDDMRLPVILVAGSYLGSISHALSCIANLRSRKLQIVSVVVNETPKSAVNLHDTAASIAAHGDVVAIQLNRHGRGDHVNVFAALTTALFSLKGPSLQEVMPERSSIAV